MTTPYFCVQDRTGTAAQLVLSAPTTDPIEVGDTGVYTGNNWDGVSVSYNFTVAVVDSAEYFCITTMTPAGASGDVTQSNWPASGTILWLTGSNAVSSPNTSTVARRAFANSYISLNDFIDYTNSRNLTYPASPADALQPAFVIATDYLDQRYRYKGVKLLQYFASGGIDPMFTYIDPWLSPILTTGGVGFAGSASLLMPASTVQHTEWPRQGVVDFNGDSVYGVPVVIKAACCEAALRVLAGIPLQPDYDLNLVGYGGIVSSLSTEVGPIKKSQTFDTKLGIGFFPDIPQIRRMLTKAGVLVAGTGRTILR